MISSLNNLGQNFILNEILHLLPFLQDLRRTGR
jgi:hypothetical protein